MCNISNMGYITINGQSVHTSSIATTGGLSTGTTTTGTYTTSYYTTATLKSFYHLMGEDIEVEGFTDLNIASTIALINTLGWKYYEELKKNNVTFSTDLEYILEQRYKVYVREQKINSILETK